MSISQNADIHKHLCLILHRHLCFCPVRILIQEHDSINYTEIDVVQLFAGEEQMMSSCLCLLLSRRQQGAFGKRILRISRKLHFRELEVLHLAAKGMSNNEEDRKSPQR